MQQRFHGGPPGARDHPDHDMHCHEHGVHNTRTCQNGRFCSICTQNRPSVTRSWPLGAEMARNISKVHFSHPGPETYISSSGVYKPLSLREIKEKGHFGPFLPKGAQFVRGIWQGAPDFTRMKTLRKTVTNPYGTWPKSQKTRHSTVNNGRKVTFYRKVDHPLFVKLIIRSS